MQGDCREHFKLYMEDIPALADAHARDGKKYRPWKQGKFTLMENGRDVATTLQSLQNYLRRNSDILRMLDEVKELGMLSKPLSSTGANAEGDGEWETLETLL